MTWSLVDSLTLSLNWKYTDPIQGDYFRIRHAGFPASGSYLIAQAELKDDGALELFGVEELKARSETETLILKKPGTFENRRIAFKRIPSPISIEAELRRVLRNALLEDTNVQLVASKRSAWQVEIEVSDYVETVPSTANPAEPQASASPAPGYTAWFAADKAVTQVEGLVSVWGDSSGNGYNAIQSNATNQPSLVSSVLNGFPVIHFNGSQFLKTPAMPAIPQPNTIFLVANLAKIDNSVVVFDGLVEASRHGIYYNVNNGQLSFFAGNDLYASVANLSNYKLYAMCLDTNSKIFVNGIQVIAGSAGSHSLSGLTIGSRFSNDYGFSGDIAELIVYDSLDNVGLTKTAEYLRTKYALF